MGNDITDEEFAQYDRQIRLWGLEAQKRLRQSKILVAGVGGLASEVIKNVVLAGVKSITLLDDRTVTGNDLGCQLLVTDKDVGKNRAVASKPRTQELNPNVIVVADEGSLDSKEDEFFHQFDIVCLTGATLEQRLRIDLACRMQRVKFFCGDVFGFYGYCFADLGMHEYVKESVQVKGAVNVDQTTAEEPEAKRKKADEDQEEKEFVKVMDEYCSLEESYQEDWSKRSRRDLRQSSPIFFIVQVMDNFQKQRKRLPTFSEEDRQLLLLLREEILQQAGIRPDYIPEDFTKFCISQLNPLCAITGGVLGQEIIKAASQRDATHNNYFFYDGLKHCGIVDTICPPVD